MKNLVKLTLALIFVLSFASCEKKVAKEEKAFKYETERFADSRILRYQVPGFDELDLKKKELLYYLYEAALSGKEIIYDQKYKHNLAIKRTVEEIYKNYNGEKNADWDKFVVYTKRVWFANGIHHHYSNQKFIPEISFDSFAAIAKNAEANGAKYPLAEGETLDQLLNKLKRPMFDPEFDKVLVNKKKGADLVAESAVNFYEGVTEKEVDTYYKKIMKKGDKTPISYGLNSKMMKENGKVVEKVWKVGGMYTQAIEKMVFWLEKALTVTENEKQHAAIEALVKYYKTGSLKDFDEFSIKWVNDTKSDIDMIHGFIEVYNDAKGYRGSYESIVQIKDPIATKRIDNIAKNAQWFEDNSPIMDAHKKKNVKGIIANIINVLVEAGDASPATPIGVNLPNSNWIRKEHGSKSVSLANIVSAYGEAKGSSLSEFAWNQEEIDRIKKYGKVAGELHTDLHEVIGHASGQINDGIGTPKETLKNYASTLEEARADLVALYFILDKKLLDLGVMPSLDAGKAEYDGYIRNGLFQQLKRVKFGDDIEEDHMRNRQLVAKWAFEKGAKDNVIERKTRDGKTFFVINDYQKLRSLFGELLKEIQRIKSEGDFAAGEHLVETYGVKVDKELHKEVLERYSKLDIPEYSGFINPELTVVKDANGKITDVKISYPDDFAKQMLFYAEKYAFLPTYN